MSFISGLFGHSRYQGKANYTDDILKENSNNLAMVDIQRMLELKQEEQSKAGYSTRFKISNHYFEIIVAIVIFYLAYLIYRAGYIPASFTFVLVAFYLLFLFAAENSAKSDYEIPWTDCPDYFVRFGSGNGNYTCHNVSPSTVPGNGYERVKQIRGLSDGMTRRERCSLASNYKGLSWEWCDDPKNQ